MREPKKAIIDVEELDNHTRNIPLAINGVLSRVDAATSALANAIEGQLDPTDRSSLLASSERVRQAAESLSSAASLLQLEASRLEAAALVAYHRAPVPKRPAKSRPRR